MSANASFLCPRSAVAAVAIEMLFFDGPILKIDATAQFLHIE